MPKRRNLRRRWTNAEMKYLRANAGKQSVTKIAHSLKRSVTAVYQQAHLNDVSLRV